jgi:Uma2 family endonuclease
MTLMEYFNTPETLLPQELIDGRVRVQDAPFVSHQRVVLKLAMALDTHTRRHREGEVFVAPIDVVLDQRRALVVQPDILVVSPERASIVQERIYGAPDLAIEVLSPHPRIGRVDERIAWFAEYGVREIWLYHQPERRLDVLACADGLVAGHATFGWEDRVRSAVLPSLDQRLGWLVDIY